jgi:streptogramin lyase
VRRILLAVVALAACTSTASGADPLRARVSPAPATLATRTWTPTISLSSRGQAASARLTLTIRRSGLARTFAPRALRRGRYRVRVVFPGDGRWTWTVAASRRTLARGTIAVDTRVRFELPYDVALEPDGTILFPDRGRVLALDAATRRVTVRATTPSDELVALVRHADGTLYGADLAGDRILRIDPSGRVSTAAAVRVPGDLVLHPDGATLWVVSLEGGVHRVDVASARVERAADAENSHGIDRAADGTLYFQDGRTVAQLRPDGSRRRLAPVDAIKHVVAPEGVYGIVGDPSGGRVLRIGFDGTVTPVAGTGSLGPHRDGRALDAQILPSAIQLGPDGTLLMAQVYPVPAIRRIDLVAGTIETLALGR